MAWLLHGTGASAHSFAGLVPLLARRFALVVPDLPGHGGSSLPRDAAVLTLPGMAAALHALQQALQRSRGLAAPRWVVGHSAGAAVALRGVMDGHGRPAAIAALNGAFLPFGGPVAPLLSPLARLMYAQGWVAGLFARRAADAAVVRRLIEGTGSRLDADGVAAYQRLMRDPRHAGAALGMMAHWDLRPLARWLPHAAVPLHLLVGERDRAVPPAQARQVAAQVPSSRLTLLPGLGHLAHEEDPAGVAQVLLAHAPA